MGRQLKRVPLDFEWPIDKVWDGFVNPLHLARKCGVCGGSGLSPEGERLRDLWYGYRTFRPEDKGSVPFTPSDDHIRAYATRQIERSPEYYGTGEWGIFNESVRLCQLWNKSWSHHLDENDVAALVAAGRLMNFTHTLTKEEGWKVKEPAYVPTAREVNIWSCGGMGHDSINQWVCAEAACERLGVSEMCAHCEGHGEIWPSQEAKLAYEQWEEVEPPEGAGYQVWETVSEGSPISPVFATAVELATYMSKTRWGADEGTSVETWLKFIEGPGWAPTMVAQDGVIRSGVDYVAENAAVKG